MGGSSIAMVWILQNADGLVVYPSNNEQRFELKPYGGLVKDALCFESIDDAHDWHDNCLLDEAFQYLDPGWSDFEAVEYTT